MTKKSEPEFIAELTPHRSLGRSGFIFLMGFVAVTCFISGMMFLAMGAWPVMAFMLLDILLVWLAFKLNYRAGRVRERVSIARDRLVVQFIDPKGRMCEHILNPLWTRFEVDRHDEIGITEMRLRNKKDILHIGGFLNPIDRESFALAFAGALNRVKA